MTPKKWLCLLGLLVLTVGFSSCGGEEGEENTLNTTNLSEDEITAVITALTAATSEANTELPTQPRISAERPVFGLKASSVQGQYSCPNSGYITWSGNINFSITSQDPLHWSVAGVVTFHLSDAAISSNDCAVSTNAISGGTLTLMIAGNDVDNVGVTLSGYVEVNSRGPTGGLVPRGSCWVALSIPRGGTQVTGSVCGRSVS